MSNILDLELGSDIDVVFSTTEFIFNNEDTNNLEITTESFIYLTLVSVTYFTDLIVLAESNSTLILTSPSLISLTISNESVFYIQLTADVQLGNISLLTTTSISNDLIQQAVYISSIISNIDYLHLLLSHIYPAFIELYLPLTANIEIDLNAGVDDVYLESVVYSYSITYLGMIDVSVSKGLRHESLMYKETKYNKIETYPANINSLVLSESDTTIKWNQIEKVNIYSYAPATSFCTLDIIEFNLTPRFENFKETYNTKDAQLEGIISAKAVRSSIYGDIGVVGETLKTDLDIAKGIIYSPIDNLDLPYFLFLKAPSRGDVITINAYKIENAYIDTIAIGSSDVTLKFDNVEPVYISSLSKSESTTLFYINQLTSYSYRFRRKLRYNHLPEDISDPIVGEVKVDGIENTALNTVDAINFVLDKLKISFNYSINKEPNNYVNAKAYGNRVYLYNKEINMYDIYPVNLNLILSGESESYLRWNDTEQVNIKSNVNGISNTNLNINMYLSNIRLEFLSNSPAVTWARNPISREESLTHVYSNYSSTYYESYSSVDTSASTILYSLILISIQTQEPLETYKEIIV